MRNARGKRAGYGWLYNWFTVDDARGLLPVGWSVPSDSEWAGLLTYLIENNAHIDSSNIGGALKSTRHEWKYPNTEATDEFGLSILPGSRRSGDGSFDFLREQANFWSSSAGTEIPPTWAYARGFGYTSGSISQEQVPFRHGYSIRGKQQIFIDPPGDGETGTLTDIDGNVYGWVAYDNTKWMTENLRTTKYANGDLIQEVTDSTDWGNLTEGARCAYNNDHYLVYPPNY